MPYGGSYGGMSLESADWHDYNEEDAPMPAPNQEHGQNDHDDFMAGRVSKSRAAINARKRKQLLSTPVKQNKPEVKNQMPAKKVSKPVKPEPVAMPIPPQKPPMTAIQAQAMKDATNEAIKAAREQFRRDEGLPSKPLILERELTYGELCQAEQEAHGKSMQKFNRMVPKTEPLIMQARFCHICYLPKVPGDAPEYQTLCVECFKAKKDFERSKPKRECRTCRKMEVFADEPDYKLDCNGCFVARKKYREEVEAKTEKRPCVACKRWIILVTEPHYKTTCGSCYVQRRKTEEDEPCRQCETCWQMCIPESSPAWKTMCTICYKHNKNLA